MELIFTPVANFGEVRRAPGVFSDLLRCVQMLKRGWDAESNGKLPHLFIPSKTAALVPEFAVEDCLRQNCSLGFSACSEGPAFGQNIDDDVYKQDRILRNNYDHCIAASYSLLFIVGSISWPRLFSKFPSQL